MYACKLSVAGNCWRWQRSVAGSNGVMGGCLCVTWRCRPFCVQSTYLWEQVASLQLSKVLVPVDLEHSCAQPHKRHPTQSGNVRGLQRAPQLLSVQLHYLHCSVAAAQRTTCLTLRVGALHTRQSNRQQRGSVWSE